MGTGIVGGGGTATILNSVKTSLFSSQTLGGLVSVGASIGLDAIGAPPILQNFVPGLLAQLTTSGSGSTGGGGGPGQLNPANLLSRIGDFAKGIGQTIIDGAKKVGQAVTSFGQAIASGFGKAIEKISSLIPREIKEFFISKGNGDLAAGVQAGTQTNGDITESVWSDFRITYDNASKDLTFANERLTTTVRNVEFGQDGDIFSAGIEMAESFGSGNSVFEVYDNNGDLQGLRFNDDVEILLNNNPFSKIESLNFQNSVVRVWLDGSNLPGLNDSYLEFKNVAGKLSGDIKIDLDRTVTLEDGIEFVNVIGQKLDAVQNVIGIPNAFADNATYKGYEPPQGKYAIKIYVDRPGENLFGDADKVGVLANGRLDVGHAFVGISDAAGNVTYIGWYPPEDGIPINGQIDPNNVTLKNIFENLHILGSVDGQYLDDSKTGRFNDLHPFDVATDWIEISSDKFDAILGTFTTGGQYSLATSNCTTFVLDVAKTAGIYLPYQPLIFANPQGLADAIEKEQKQQENG